MKWGRRSLRTLVLSTAAALFLVLCVLPVLYLVGRAFADNGSSSIGALLLDARQRSLLVNSGLLAAGTAVLATLIGAPLGIALARVPFRGKFFIRTALAAPFALPPYVVGLAWIYLGGSRGLVATLLGQDVLSEWTYSLSGAVIVLSLVFYPLPMLATEAALRGIDGRIEEAGLLVTSPWRVLRFVTLPLASPAILAAGLVTFVLAASEFGVPGLLRVRVYTTEILTAFAALYDVGRATLLSLPLVLLSVAVAAMAGSIAGHRVLAQRRGHGAPSIMAAQWRRPAIGLTAVVIAAALVMPVAVLLRESATGGSLTGTIQSSRAALTNSLLLATGSATAAMALGLCLGYWRARTLPAMARLADVLLVVSFARPSTVVGVGLIAFWNRPGPVGAVYGTSAMIVLAYLARLLPVAALVLAAGIRLVPASHEEAAAVSGAGWLRTMWRIVVPQLTPALAAAWIVAFVLAFGELGATVLVAPPGDATLPIYIYTMIANAPSSQVAALALLQTAAIVYPLVALGLAGTAVRRHA